MDTKLLHVRDKLEFIIRFMMAGDGSFKARLSEAYRHPQYGLRQIPMIFMPGYLREEFAKLLKDIDKNENSRVLNDVKMALTDEIFMFYKKVCSTISTQALAEYEKKTFAPPQLIEQSDVPTAPVKKARKPRAKKISKG